jgi:hypothetical protein
MAPKIQTGQKVEISYENRTVQGQVRLASANGKNMILSFPAASPLGDYLESIPVLEDGGVFRDLIKRRPVTVRGVKS